MSNFVFFSKSMWNETPRMRHQFAKLLLNDGNKVFFFQKPCFFWQKKIPTSYLSEMPLTLLQTRQLIHHQLRWNSMLRYVNGCYESSQIASATHELPADFFIVNFNYDYYFLREIFPDKKIATVINDDFVAQSKFFEGAHALKSLAYTCEMSDAVLVVSTPLAKQVKDFCDPILFLPWSDVEYRKPALNPSRNRVLLWAHIDERVDFDLIGMAANECRNFQFDLVGPVAPSVSSVINDVLANNSNVFLRGPILLDQLPIDKYFCSIIPYKKGVKDIEAVTASNKTFQLLARGLPIVTHGMPYFLDSLCVKKAASGNDFIYFLNLCLDDFEGLQYDIEILVANNLSGNRLAELNRLFSIN